MVYYYVYVNSITVYLYIYPYIHINKPLYTKKPLFIYTKLFTLVFYIIFFRKIPPKNHKPYFFYTRGINKLLNKNKKTVTFY
jgi:hypothetical protein